MNTTNTPLNYLSYFNNRGQICLYETHKNLNSLEVIPWSYVSRILFVGDDTITCPICIGRVELPRTDKCGHIFCLQCLINLFKHETTDSVACPLCKTNQLKLSNMKRVTIHKCKSYTVGDNIDLNIIAKGFKSLIPRSGFKLIYENFSGLSQSLEDFNYSYVSYDYDKRTERLINKDLKYYNQNKKTISKVIGEEVYQDTLNHLHEELVHFIDFKQMMKYCETESLTSGTQFNLLKFSEHYERFNVYYQSSKSKYTLYDPTALKKILDNYAELNLIPPVKIRGKIIEINKITATRSLLDMYNIKHIPVGATITWVKCDPETFDNVFLYGEAFKKLNDEVTVQLKRDEQMAEIEKQKLLERIKKTPGERYLPNVIKNMIKKKCNLKESGWELEQDRAAAIAYRQNLNQGFNTCLLGIECVAPDEDSVHSNNCPHYNKSNPYNQDENSNESDEMSDKENENCDGASSQDTNQLDSSDEQDNTVYEESIWVLRSQEDAWNELDSDFVDTARNVPVGSLQSARNCSSSAQDSHLTGNDNDLKENGRLKVSRGFIDTYLVEAKPQTQREMKNRRKAAKKY